MFHASVYDRQSTVFRLGRWLVMADRGGAFLLGFPNAGLCRSQRNNDSPEPEFSGKLPHTVSIAGSSSGSE